MNRQNLIRNSNNFQIKLNYHLSMSDFLLSFMVDVDKQVAKQLLSVPTRLGLKISGYLDGSRTIARPEEHDSEDIVSYFIDSVLLWIKMFIFPV